MTSYDDDELEPESEFHRESGFHDWERWRPCPSGVVRRFAARLRHQKTDLARRKALSRGTSLAAAVLLGGFGLLLFRRPPQTAEQPALPPVRKATTVGGQPRSLASRRRSKIKMRMNCNLFLNQLDRYIADDGPDCYTRIPFHCHLKKCKSCREQYALRGGDVSRFE